MAVSLVNAALAQPTAARAGAPEVTIIPRPAQIELREGVFELGPAARIRFDRHPEFEASRATELLDYLRLAIGLERMGEHGENADDAAIRLALESSSSVTPEAYSLEISPRRVELRAAHPRGLFAGIQTIRQLVVPVGGTNSPATETANPATLGSRPRALRCVKIVDFPRFPHRGMLLDCCRHFWPKEFVKRYIDLLALHKMNVLHWHLTEDQGWRIEIKKYPKLTELGAWRAATRDTEQPRDALGRYGGYYTQDDVREIVAYAASRYITVIPEIELPGHSLAALVAYPEYSCTGGPFKVRTEWGVEEDVYCAGNDKTFEFIQDVLSDVVELFPGKYIHIGGDECPKSRWKVCPKCQARIKAEGLKDEHELQSYFIRRVEKFLTSKNRRLIGWDEILEGGLAPNATVQSWRGMDGAIAAASSGHDVISSPTSHCYLDYPQEANPAAPAWMGFIDLKKIYDFEPVPEKLTADQARHVLGAEGNIWAERTPTADDVDRQVWPRLAALAEVCWSPKESRDFDNFSARMQEHYKRLDVLGVKYFVPMPMLTVGEMEFTDATTLKLGLSPQCPIGAEICYTLDGSEPTAASPLAPWPKAPGTPPLPITTTTVVKARTLLPGRHGSRTAELRLRKLVANEPVAVAGSQPGLDVVYYDGEWSTLPNFATLEPIATGTAATIDVSSRKRDANYALRFTGLIAAPTDGVYTFYIEADDRARLSIGRADPLVIDAQYDGGERQGKVVLRAGRHPLTLEYAQLGGAQKLLVSYEGPGLARQAIPAAALSRP